MRRHRNGCTTLTEVVRKVANKSGMNIELKGRSARGFPHNTQRQKVMTWRGGARYSPGYIFVVGDILYVRTYNDGIKGRCL